MGQKAHYRTINEVKKVNGTCVQRFMLWKRKNSKCGTERVRKWVYREWQNTKAEKTQVKVRTKAEQNYIQKTERNRPYKTVRLFHSLCYIQKTDRTARKVLRRAKVRLFAVLLVCSRCFSWYRATKNTCHRTVCYAIARRFICSTYVRWLNRWRHPNYVLFWGHNPKIKEGACFFGGGQPLERYFTAKNVPYQGQGKCFAPLTRAIFCSFVCTFLHLRPPGKEGLFVSGVLLVCRVFDHQKNDFRRGKGFAKPDKTALLLSKAFLPLRKCLSVSASVSNREKNFKGKTSAVAPLKCFSQFDEVLPTEKAQVYRTNVRSPKVNQKVNRPWKTQSQKQKNLHSANAWLERFFCCLFCFFPCL